MASVVTQALAGAAAITGARSTEERVHAIVTEHYDFVWRSLRRLGVPEATADDEAQQVFCVFAKRAAEVPDGKEKTFLFGVAMRVAQASRRITARRAEVIDEERIDRIATEAKAPDELLDEARARVLLDRLLEAMPLDLRTVFILYELEEMTMADIASTLALPSGTVASRLRRARETFRTLARETDAHMQKGAVR